MLEVTCYALTTFEKMCFLLLEALRKLTYQLFHAGLTCQWRINDIKASYEKIGAWPKMAAKVAIPGTIYGQVFSVSFRVSRLQGLQGLQIRN